MSWIAKEYGLKLPRDYAVKESCSRSFGDKTDINKDVCWYIVIITKKLDKDSPPKVMIFRTGKNTRCDFVLTEAATGQAQCSVFSQEGIAYNVNRCIDTNVGLQIVKPWPKTLSPQTPRPKPNQVPISSKTQGAWG